MTNPKSARQYPAKTRLIVICIAVALVAIVTLSASFWRKGEGGRGERIATLTGVVGLPGEISPAARDYFLGNTLTVVRKGKTYQITRREPGGLVLSTKEGATERILYKHDAESPDRTILNLVVGTDELFFLTEVGLHSAPINATKRSLPDRRSVGNLGTYSAPVNNQPLPKGFVRRRVPRSLQEGGELVSPRQWTLFRISLADGKETKVLPNWGSAGEPRQAILREHLTPAGIYWQQRHTDFEFQVVGSKLWWTETTADDRLLLSPSDGSPPKEIARGLSSLAFASFADGIISWCSPRPYPSTTLDLMVIPENAPTGTPPTCLRGLGTNAKQSRVTPYNGRFYWIDTTPSGQNHVDLETGRFQWTDGTLSGAQSNSGGGATDTNSEAGGVWSCAMDGTDPRVVVPTRDSENHIRTCQTLSLLGKNLYVYFTLDVPSSEPEEKDRDTTIRREHLVGSKPVKKIPYVARLHPELPAPLGKPVTLPDVCAMGPLDEKYYYYTCVESLGWGPAVLDLFSTKGVKIVHQTYYRAPLPE